MHVGVNFGGAQGLQLFVDGLLASETTDATFGSYDYPCDGDYPCNTSTTKGIMGNSNPWVIGANSMSSQDGQAGPVYLHLGGAVDYVRISSVRRDFSAGAS